MTNFKLKIEERFSEEFYGMITAQMLRRLDSNESTHLRASFRTFLQSTLTYVDKWFRVERFPKDLAWISLKEKKVPRAEVMSLAEQIAPELNDNELFDEITTLNETLETISDEKFSEMNAEQKWMKLFEAKLPNLLLLVSKILSIPVSNACVERVFSLCSAQWTDNLEAPWDCPKCKSKQPATRSTKIWRVPKVLIVHLKRFSQNNGNFVKNEAAVTFDVNELDLSPYVHEKSPLFNATFSLYAITNHSGRLLGWLPNTTARTKGRQRMQMVRFKGQTERRRNARLVTKHKRMPWQEQDGDQNLAFVVGTYAASMHSVDELFELVQGKVGDDSIDFTNLNELQHSIFIKEMARKMEKLRLDFEQMDCSECGSCGKQIEKIATEDLAMVQKGEGMATTWSRENRDWHRIVQTANRDSECASLAIHTFLYHPTELWPTLRDALSCYPYLDFRKSSSDLFVCFKCRRNYHDLMDYLRHAEISYFGISFVTGTTTIASGVPSSTLLPSNWCQHPKDEGHCAAHFMRWFWDGEAKKCEQFQYGGCGGNGNNFGSREECLSICHREVTPPVEKSVDPGSDVCESDIDEGQCRSTFIRYAFDRQTGECRQFKYGGCGGNGNNFATLADCKKRCTPPETGGEERGRGDRVGADRNGSEILSNNICEHRIDPGECSGVFHRFGYDTDSNRCKQFMYGGCGGNGNNFAIVADCKVACVRSECPKTEPKDCDLTRCHLVKDGRGCALCSCAPPRHPPLVPGPSSVGRAHCPPVDTQLCVEPCIVFLNSKSCQECVCLLLPPPQPSSGEGAQPPAAPALPEGDESVSVPNRPVPRPVDPSVSSPPSPPSPPAPKLIEVIQHGVPSLLGSSLAPPTAATPAASDESPVPSSDSASPSTPELALPSSAPMPIVPIDGHQRHQSQHENQQQQVVAFGNNEICSQILSDLFQSDKSGISPIWEMPLNGSIPHLPASAHLLGPSLPSPLFCAFISIFVLLQLQDPGAPTCTRFVQRWFFNVERAQCESFTYTGCAGNRNHFFSQKECQIYCGRFLRKHRHNALRRRQSLSPTVAVPQQPPPALSPSPTALPVPEIAPSSPRAMPPSPNDIEGEKQAFDQKQQRTDEEKQQTKRVPLKLAEEKRNKWNQSNQKESNQTDRERQEKHGLDIGKEKKTEETLGRGGESGREVDIGHRVEGGEDSIENINTVREGKEDNEQRVEDGKETERGERVDKSRERQT
ncbi:hypothetical protein niasHT_016392 [Heterodera trifolii]|uniref:BPTI/Kunitz inhibitor domain-containing protein n=1 Tax=Heterodera trifolii TaxID=157864 RepID=A0ABD2LKC6_9BILA